MAEDSHVQMLQDLAFCGYQFQRRAVQTMTDAMFENALIDFAAEGGGSVTLTPSAGGICEWRPPRGMPVQFTAGRFEHVLLKSIEDACRPGSSRAITLPSSTGEYLAWVAAGPQPASEALRNESSFRRAGANALVFGRFASDREKSNRFVTADKAGPHFHCE